LVWELSSKKKCGCKRFRFNNHIVDLIAEPDGKQTRIKVWSNGNFKLTVIKDSNSISYDILKGKTTIRMDNQKQRTRNKVYMS